MTHEQVYCTFSFLKASAHISTPSGLTTSVIPTSFELKVNKTVLEQFQKINWRKRRNLTHKLAKSVKIATEEYWSDLALKFGSFSTGFHFLNNKKRRKISHIYYQKHKYMETSIVFQCTKRKKRPVGINAIERKVNLPLICEHIVSHLTMNPSWPSNLRLPKSKTYMGIKQLWFHRKWVYV